MVMALTFFMYDGLVSRRNKKVMSAAVRSTAIVTSLFPSQVRDRLYAGEADAGSTNINDLAASSTTRLKRFVDKGTGAVDDDKDDDEVILKSKPIADLFPETTVMFAEYVVIDVFIPRL